MKLRFSIRDLLWLTLACALSVGWWLTSRELAETFRRKLPKDNEILSPQVNAIDEEHQPFVDEGIHLGLFSNIGAGFSPPSFDPEDSSTPAHVGLQITNGSSREITLPASYDGKKMKLFARSEWPLLLVPRDSTKIDTIQVAPGEQKVCFLLPLSEIFKYEMPNLPAKSKWRWSWTAHPGPPQTPIHRDNGELLSEAVFWGEVVINNRTLRTVPIIIRVKKP